MEHKKRQWNYIVRLFAITLILPIVLLVGMKYASVLFAEFSTVSVILFQFFLLIIELNFLLEIANMLKEVTYTPKKALIVEINEKEAIVLFDCSHLSNINDGTIDANLLPCGLKKGDNLLYLKNQNKWIVDDIKLK